MTTNERILILMPTAVDGERMRRVLEEAGLSGVVCKDMEVLCREITAGAELALLTEEVVAADPGNRLQAALQNQPSWSDFPLVVLASEGTAESGYPLCELMNAMLVERPVKYRSLLSVVRAALRSRRHQYAIRDHLEERRQSGEDRALLAAIVESSGDAIISKSLDGVILSWNAGAERLFGYTPAEAIGQPITLVIPPERQSEEPAILERLRCGERVEHFETVRVTKDGRRIDISLAISPLRNAEGQVVGASKVARDISGRRRAEAEVLRVTAESERQRRMYETALSNTADFVYLFDLKGRFTYVNKALLDLWGKSLSEAMGKDFFELDYPPDLADRLQHQIREVIATRQSLRDETPYTSTDGTRSYEYIFVPVFGASGEVEAVAGSTRDITDRKRTEVALRSSEERYRVLVTASADVVYRMSADWSEMYPLDGRALIASNTVLIRGWMQKNLPVFEHARVSEAIRHAIASRQPFEMEHQVIRPDGTLGWTNSRAAPILNAQGEIVEWFGTARDVTDRKRAGEELKRLAEALGLALAAADLGTWEWDPTTDFMSLSRRTAEIYGLDPLGPHRRDILRGLLHPDDRDRAREVADKAVKDRADYDIEYRLTRHSGDPVWVAVRGRGVYDEAGNLIRMNGVVQDITDRKRAEAELQDIRSRMEAALAAGAIGTWSWDVPGDRFYGDVSLARIFSVAPEDVAGGPLSRIVNAIHPEDRNRVLDLVNRAIKSGWRYEVDYRVAQRDGSWGWVTARGQVERDAGGRAVKFPGVVIDITERKRVEESLAHVTEESGRRKRLYEAILSSTPDFVYVFSLDHRVVYANDALIAMWGAGDPVGKSFLELGYEAWHAEMHDREIDQVRKTKKPIRGEVPFSGTHGRKIYDYIFVPVLGMDGEVEAVAGTTRDVTDRKAMEEELRSADRKKDDFIALLAHELRNPLAPIRNGLEVFRLSEDKDTQLDAQGIMERQLSHMVRLIDDLLDVSRINRNKMELRRSRLLLRDVVSSALETVRPVIDSEGHELMVSLPGSPVYLDADLTRLAQVFSNLLTNSAKYTPSGGKIWLSAECHAGEVLVSVRDTGIGIPPDSLENIFDMFSQVDRSVERSTGGLGIGLALVKGLVEMHGGTVTAESAGEGAGSTFTVTLPMLADRTKTEEKASINGQTVGSQGRRILVVDDNRDGAESLALMLRLMGNEIRIANDGIAAVEAASEFLPEVVLMDVGMPRLNGLDATRRIREQAWGKQMTIIALTGWGQENDRDRSYEAGCDGHLVKPVNLPDLEKFLTNVRR